MQIQLTRVCFLIVFAWNVLCAMQFILNPGAYAPGFLLSGVEGDVAVRGIGVAFLMWNATYPLFIWRPAQHMALGGVVLAQQIIGLIGESFILTGLPSAGYSMLFESIGRFIVFDAIGLIIMGASFALLALKLRKTH